MIAEKEFESFGVKYRTKQFSAARGVELLFRSNEVYPTEYLEKTEVLFEFSRKKKEWISLSDSANIDKGVRDKEGLLRPRIVLEGLLMVVYDFSFGFLKTWKGVKVPRRFISDAKSVSTEYTDPLISQLIQEDYASLRELEEYYSLEDAFRMFDIMTAKGVNAAYQHEQAERESKSKSR
jgi:hypothetical protein